MVSTNRQLWVSWFLLTLFFFNHYFVRVSPGLLSGDFMREFSILPGKIGLISSGYFIVYTFSQLPVGFLMTRYSAKFLISIASICCALCALGIATAPSYYMMLACYLCFAFFGSFGFVGAVTFAAQQIPQYQSVLLGFTQSLGMAAGFAATNWLTYAIAHAPWQKVITQVSWVLLATALIIALFACKGNPVHHPEEKNASGETIPTATSSEIFFNPQTWFNSLYAGTNYFPVMMIIEGGMGPSILASIHTSSSPQMIAFAISMTFIGWMVAGPFAGVLADKYGRVFLMKISALFGAVFAALILYVPMSPTMLCITLFLFGVTNTGIIGCYSVAAEMHGPANAGLSLAIANMFTILVGSILSGVLPSILELTCEATIIDGVPIYQAIDYQTIFSCMIYIPLISLLCAMLTKETGSQFQKPAVA